MRPTYTVRCPDCGNLAVRTHAVGLEPRYDHSSANLTIKTECHSCDYLMIICSVSGKVIETGSSCMLSINRNRQQQVSNPSAIMTENSNLRSWSKQLPA